VQDQPAYLCRLVGRISMRVEEGDRRVRALDVRVVAQAWQRDVGTPSRASCSPVFIGSCSPRARVTEDPVLLPRELEVRGASDQHGREGLEDLADPVAGELVDRRRGAQPQ